MTMMIIDIVIYHWQFIWDEKLHQVITCIAKQSFILTFKRNRFITTDVLLQLRNHLCAHFNLYVRKKFVKNALHFFLSNYL